MKDEEFAVEETAENDFKKCNFEDAQRVIEYIYILIIVDFLQQFNDADFLCNIFARLF